MCSAVMPLPTGLHDAPPTWHSLWPYSPQTPTPNRRSRLGASSPSVVRQPCRVAYLFRDHSEDAQFDVEADATERGQRESCLFLDVSVMHSSPEFLAIDRPPFAD